MQSNLTHSSKPEVELLTRIRDVMLNQDGSLRYNAILLDQFGVLHDGQTAFPAALDCMSQLHQLGVLIVILSNSSRRGTQTLRKLCSTFNCNPDWIHSVITSGEIAFQTLSEDQRSTQEKFSLKRPLGKKVLHADWTTRRRSRKANDEISPDSLSVPPDYQSVGLKAESADFVLAHGTEGFRESEENVLACRFEEMIDIISDYAMRESSGPMLCANPDLVTVDGGVLRPMPGQLAQAFEQAGGRVFRLGKPDPIIYTAALGSTELSNPNLRWLAIGDSLQHDIAGGNGVDIDTLFIAGGILSEDFGLEASAALRVDKNDWPMSASKVHSKLLEAASAEQLGDSDVKMFLPRFAIPYFSW